jgi:hypothetical protein
MVRLKSNYKEKVKDIWSKCLFLLRQRNTVIYITFKIVYYDQTNKKYFFFCKEEIFLYFSLSMRKLTNNKKITKNILSFHKRFFSCPSLISFYEKITKKIYVVKNFFFHKFGQLKLQIYISIYRCVIIFVLVSTFNKSLFPYVSKYGSKGRDAVKTLFIIPFLLHSVH